MWYIDLTIRSGGSNTCLIRRSNSTEPGWFWLVFREYESCWTRPSTVTKHNDDNSALLIVNSTDIRLIEISFYRSKGRGLSIIAVVGISNCTFVAMFSPLEMKFTLGLGVAFILVFSLV